MRHARRLALLLVILGGLAAPLAAGPRAVRADDDDGALQALRVQVQSLLEHVARLEAEVTALKGRVAWLEARSQVDTEDAEPARARATATVEIRTHDPVAGHWKLEPKATGEAMVARQAPSAEDPAEEAMVRELLRDALVGVAMDIWLEEGGAWRVRISRPGSEGETASGTWTRRPDGTYLLVTTHENGVESEDKDDRIRGRLEAEQLVLEEEASQTVLIFVR